MKAVSVYFTQPGFDDYPFDKDDYRLGYYKLGELLAERGIVFGIVRAPHTHVHGNEFKGGWVLEGGDFRRYEEARTMDVIFNKGRITFDSSARVLNDPEIDRICTDKTETYRLFSDISPLTITVTNRKEFEAALEKIPSETVVAKPIDGEEGKGVFIGTREQVRSKVKTFPYLVQELIDTSGGIPGIAPGRHDLRLITVQGELVSAFVRMPKEGSYLANVAQGGSIKDVPIETIPPAATTILRRIDETFHRFPRRIYSVDLGRDRNGEWKIIELNAQPGLSIEDYDDGPGGKKLFNAIADLLASAASS